jgi:hypothetical protein
MLIATNRLGRFGTVLRAVIYSQTARFGATVAGVIFLTSSSAAWAGIATLDTSPTSPSVQDDRSHYFQGQSISKSDGDGAEEQIFQGDLVSARSVTDFARNSQPFGVLSGHFNVFSGLAALRPLSLGGQGLAETIADLHDRRPPHATPSKAVSAESSPVGESRKTPSEFAFDQSVIAAAAASNTPQGNVLIPLPSAALSGLSVMGGLGVFAGIRRALRGIR